MYYEMTKEGLLDKHREINVDHPWWNYTVEEFSNRLLEKGICVNESDVLFSGFCSQGDGASFEGYILTHDVKRFMELHGLDKQYAPAYYFAQLREFDIKVNRMHSMYCHSELMILNVDGVIDADDAEDDIRGAVYKTMAEQFELTYIDFEQAVLKILKGYANELYRELEREYEYLVSDEAVEETLEANNYFDELTEEKEDDHGICSDQR